MANSVLTADIIAKEALVILDNELVMAKKVHRGYEKEFGNTVSGHEVGDTVSIRRPTDFTVRDGRTASNQDVVEGSTSLTVDKQKGVDFKFTSADLSLDIKNLSDRLTRRSNPACEPSGYRPSGSLFIGSQLGWNAGSDDQQLY